MYLTQRQAVVRSIQQGQNRLLPLKQSVSAAERWHILSLPEAHGHAIAAFLDLRSWQSGGGRQLPHLERPAAPLLDNAAPVERAGNQRCPGNELPEAGTAATRIRGALSYRTTPPPRAARRPCGEVRALGAIFGFPGAGLVQPAGLYRLGHSVADLGQAPRARGLKPIKLSRRAAINRAEPGFVVLGAPGAVANAQTIWNGPPTGPNRSVS